MMQPRGGTGGRRRRTPTNTLNSSMRVSTGKGRGTTGPSSTTTTTTTKTHYEEGDENEETDTNTPTPTRTSASIHLPSEQQMELARCVRTWTDCKNVKAEQEEILGRPLSFTEWALALDMSENTLRRQVADGKAARELLIKTNINLIKSMAVKLYRRQEHNENRLSVDDLVLEGTQGIIKAAMKFDPYREIKFSTYAVWWIRQAISLAIQTHSNTVRLPVLLQTRIKKVRDARTRLYLDLEREPSHDEVAAMVGLPREKVKQIRRSGRSRHFLNEDDFMITGLAMDIHSRTHSLPDTPLGGRGDGERRRGSSRSPLLTHEQEERRKMEQCKEAVLRQLTKQGDREIVQSRWETFTAAKAQPAVTGRKLRRIQGELMAIVLEKDFEDRKDVFSSLMLCAA